MKRMFAALAALLAVSAAPARADITVGAILSLTGPAASLGIPERNVIDMLPREIAGQKVRYVVLDDGTDSSAAVRAFQKLVTEEKVDIIFGPSVTPPSLAVLDAAGSSGTPMISLAGSQGIIMPPEGNKRWAFKLAAPESAMLASPMQYLKDHGGKTFATIAQATAFGDAFAAAAQSEAAKRGIKSLGVEKYNLTDTSVTPQVLKIMALKPDAVFIAGSGTPGALPVIELRNRGYKGLILHNQGVANPDFLRVAGKAADGIILAAAPVTVAEQLPDGSDAKKPAMDYVKLYEGKYGANSRSLFGASAWDAFLLLEKATPIALKTAAPGTPAFRTALRDAMENLKNVFGASGIYSMTPTDHNGTDERSLVLITVKGGRWELLK
jgi:branched-chain amino acid transport system substrate-binding protein